MVSPAVSPPRGEALSGASGAESHGLEAGARCAGRTRDMNMQQQISVITLGVADLARSRRFYVEGFGWAPVFENAEIVFYQMNGLMLGTWRNTALAEDLGRPPEMKPGIMALAHNVPALADVAPLMEALCAAGGTLVMRASAPPHGGYRGYVADPDGHAWEIAWNSAWPISREGHVTFGL